MIAVPESPLTTLSCSSSYCCWPMSRRRQKMLALPNFRSRSPCCGASCFAKVRAQPGDDDSPQLAMFNEAEELVEAAPEAAAEETEEETVAPAKRRGRRKSLPANLPRVEIIHELPEHELTCECGCRKRVIGEETSEQLEIIPMQVRVIRHIRKTYACKACEAAPITADKPAQLIEKSLASPSVLAMLLTAKYADGIPLYRFEKMLSRHGVDVPRQTLARWVINALSTCNRCSTSCATRCSTTPCCTATKPGCRCCTTGRDPTAQSRMWVQAVAHRANR